MKKIFYVAFISVLACSCSNNGSSSMDNNTGSDSSAVQAALDKLILGEWNNTTLKVKINTALNSDSTGYIDVDESNWERVLKTKPMTTIFGDDGSYRLVYKSMQDSIITASSGTWYVVNDSIFMNQKQPDATFFQYHLTVKDNMATLSGLVDWEGDGKTDDEYMGTLKK